MKWWLVGIGCWLISIVGVVCFFRGIGTSDRRLDECERAISGETE
jgi:hypothetical protein